ncbi:MAG: hypothetical protein A4E62_00366 [Syntrophorhabdus sp. PtaU1.Bin002]|nr:MAG: hypothetical protein A4E62_00366 [Syntrophorhabdus sp. PtaU1.Bin002]
MRKSFVLCVLIVFGFVGLSCTSTGYNTQTGAAIGAGLGALAGQIIGRNTTGTLIGLAGGALVGAIAGNAVDQNEMNRRLDSRESRAYASPGTQPEVPPGRWVEVPGQWVGGKWVPTHKAWVPMNP